MTSADLARPDPARLVADGTSWLLAQPSDVFGIDGKCVLLGMGVLPADQVPAVVAEKLALIRANRLPDGGYRSKYGGPASVLWTADALGWLWRTGGHGDPSSVSWLAGRQLADGSWLERQDIDWPRSWYRASNAHLWITAALVQSLSPEPAGCADLVAASWRFLDRAAGQFAALTAARADDALLMKLGFDRFSLAVTIDLYRAAGRPFGATAEAIGWMSRAQAADGTWEDSLDVTQATATALLTLTGDPGRPEIVRAAECVAARRTAAGGWGHRPGDPPDWTLTAYTTRFLHRLSAARDGD